MTPVTMLSSHDMISSIPHAAAQGRQAAAAAGSCIQVPGSKIHVEAPAYELVGTWVQHQAQQAGVQCEIVVRLVEGHTYHRDVAG